MSSKRTDIKQLEDEIQKLQLLLQTKRSLLNELKQNEKTTCPYSQNLTTEEISRYSRQIIMPQIKMTGQIALKKSKILIVGAGGLGCPASQYLAAAGVGEIHIADYDKVELSNLHRQILHFESDVGVPKVTSVYNKLTSMNSNLVLVALHIHADSSILETVSNNNYDVVIDCSDNVATRYLLNDVCVLRNIPLVSGSALQMEGQLTVYHYKNGPCYRCLFPVPPPAYTVTNCGDGGVLGVVPGVIGVLEALEAIKIITKAGEVLSGRMLLFDAADSLFRNVKLRLRIPTCEICGDKPNITKLIDYEQFCGSMAHDKVVDIDVLKNDEHISAKELFKFVDSGDKFILDVRPEVEFEMCKLPKTVNFPYSKIVKEEEISALENLIRDQMKVYVLCRRGNDSQRAISHLKQLFTQYQIQYINIQGGLHAYAKLDLNFPLY